MASEITETNELKYVILSNDQNDQASDNDGTSANDRIFVTPEEPGTSELYRPDEQVQEDDSTWSGWFKNKYETTKQYVEVNVKPAASQAYEKTKEGAAIAYEKTKEGAGVAIEKTKEGFDNVTTYVAETNAYKNISHKIVELRNKDKNDSEQASEEQPAEDELIAGEIAEPQISRREQLKTIIVEKVINPSKQFANYIAEEVENLRQKDLEHDEELRKGHSSRNASHNDTHEEAIANEQHETNATDSEQQFAN